MLDAGDITTARLPRMAFNFDGELDINNRGIVEIIEVLKLDRRARP
jgi:predicted Ser/Thr protein kinase